MDNRFDSNMYLDSMMRNKGNISIISYPQLSCPNSHPINFGYVDNFDNGQLNICGRICKN